jgi:hypothetical protein
MRSYKTINWYQKNIDEIWEYLFEEIEEKEQFPFFKFLMQNYPNIELDWLECFDDISVGLYKDEKIDEIIYFVSWFIDRFPETYNNEYELIEGGLCDYYIRKKDWNNVEKRLEIIKKNPVAGIEFLTENVLFQLIYHKQYAMAVDYAKAVWNPIYQSEDLIGFPAYSFINTIYVDDLQHYYEAWLKDNNFDAEPTFRNAVSMGFDDDRPLFDTVIKELKSELDISEIIKSIEDKSSQHMIILNIHFLKFMHSEYNMPFVFSEWMWNFISSVKLFYKPTSNLDNWFYLNAKTLADHIDNHFDFLIGLNEVEIFGKIWGLDYVFHFLNKNKLLSDKHYELMQENITHFKIKMIYYSGDNLWNHAYVFDWPKINNVPNNTSDRALFEDTYLAGIDKSMKSIKEYFSNYRPPQRINIELKNTHSTKDFFDDKFSEFNLDSEFDKYLEKPMPIKSTKPDIGRNDPCFCGSGKKYKKCCIELAD